ncbi:MAG: molybdopterin molybdotransferase MoeA [Planctomycetes bacterium]|nr:molybdopterin molybdotransferase MoeA [Planctomycetota bacterium]
MVNPIELREARARVLARVGVDQRVERVPLAEACGRTLAAAVRTSSPWPTTDRSAMDGFALAAGAGKAAGTVMPVVGESLAGKPFAGVVPAGAAIRIMTGAVLPEGADAVVPVEQTSGYRGAEVRLDEPVVAGANVRRRGSEQVADAEVLRAGQRIGPAEVGVLAVLGTTTVPARRRPVVVIVATGDEVVPVEREPLPHQVRESNSWSLAAQVEACGGLARRVGVAPDEPVGLRRMLERALADADVVLTIGGVSKGTHDLVHGTLHDLGVGEVFHGIWLKPGKPTFFGVRDGAPPCYVFGLPGNPASTFTVFDLLVRPLLAAWLGEAPGEWGARLPVLSGTWKVNRRLQAVPARVAIGDDGRLGVALVKPSPSGDPFELTAASGYVLIEPGVGPTPDAMLPFVGNTQGIVLP